MYHGFGYLVYKTEDLLRLFYRRGRGVQAGKPVVIKDTNERLTQPGKICLVYINPKDIKAYGVYISYLQQKGMLLDDLEELELEELQGINGLKALRVGVNVDFEEEGEL